MADRPTPQRHVPPRRRDSAGGGDEPERDAEPVPYTGRHGTAMRDAFRDLASELGDMELARRIGAAGTERFEVDRWASRLNRLQKGAANVAHRRAGRELRRRS